VVIDPEKLCELVFYEVGKANAGKEGWRAHLGASVIADSCERKGYFTFRWYSVDVREGRMCLLLDRGQREEPSVIESLRTAGLVVRPYENERRKRQWSFIDPDNPAFAGSCDGIASLPAEIDPSEELFLLEIKTANQANFRKMKKKGLLISKPIYFGQAQSYMRWSRYRGLSVEHTLFCVVNKNTDERYYEWVKYDPAFARDLAMKADRILNATSSGELRRISDKQEYFECSYCQHKDVCHNDAPPAKNCRTCKHVEHKQYPDSGRSRWRCGGPGEHGGSFITLSHAKLGCDIYESK